MLNHVIILDSFEMGARRGLWKRGMRANDPADLPLKPEFAARPADLLIPTLCDERRLACDEALRNRSRRIDIRFDASG